MLFGQTLKEKKIKVKAFLLGGYAQSFTENVDKTGRQGDGRSAGGYLKYARVNATYYINEKMSIQTLVNLADFQSNPKDKVLEILALRYRYSPYFNVILGQFRPFFGLEDMYPAELMKSNAWSKQYSLMSSSQWQSFQIGVAFYGNANISDIPLRYYYTLHNGNGKNKIKDDDGHKTHAFRLEISPIKDLYIALNESFTMKNGDYAKLFGIDGKYDKNFSENWHFGVSSEYKYGTNLSAFRVSKNKEKEISEYDLSAFYIVPFISKIIGKKREILEFSFRYEYLKDLPEANVGRFYTPMLSYIFTKKQSSKISVAGIFTDYDENISSSTKHDSNMLLVQYQFQF